MSSNPLPTRTTRPIVPMIGGMSSAFQHEFKPVTPRIPNLGGGGGTNTNTSGGFGSGISQPVRSGVRASSTNPTSANPSPSDPFEKRGAVSTTLAEARALVNSMDYRGGGGGGMAPIVGGSSRPASLIDPSRPYTPRLSRRSSPFQQQSYGPPSPSGSPKPYPSSSPSSHMQYPSYPSDQSDSQRQLFAGRGDDAGVDDDPDDAAFASRFGTRPKQLIRRTSSRASISDQEIADLDQRPTSRPDSVMSMNSTNARSRSGSTASPITILPPGSSQSQSQRRSSPVTSLNFQNLVNPNNDVSVLPSSVGTEEDWRHVESTPGDETSRPGTAMSTTRQGSAGSTRVILSVASASRSQQAAAAAAAAAASAATSVSGVTGVPLSSPPRPPSGSASNRPVPPSGTPSPNMTRPRSRPTSSNNGTNTTTSDTNSATTTPITPPISNDAGIKVELRTFDSNTNSISSVPSSSSSSVVVTPTQRPSSAIFTRPLEVKSSDSNTNSTPSTSTSSSTSTPSLDDSPILSLHELQQLKLDYDNSIVTEKPDLLRTLLTQTTRTLTYEMKSSSASTNSNTDATSTTTNTNVTTLVPLLRFTLSLPGGDASSRLHQQCVRCIFEMSRDGMNDQLILDLVPDLTREVLERPNKGMKVLSCVLGILHNLTVEGGSSSSSASSTSDSSSSPLLVPNFVHGLGRLLTTSTWRILKLVDTNGNIIGGSTNEDSLVKFLIEVTSVLRNLACINGSENVFVQPLSNSTSSSSSSAPTSPSSSLTSTNDVDSSSPPRPQQPCLLDLLCHLVIKLGHQHSNLLLNLTRILSKLSLHQPCRMVMYHPSLVIDTPMTGLQLVTIGSSTTSTLPPSRPASASSSPSNPFLTSLVGSLQTHHVKLSLCIRVLYILGNLTMGNDECRQMIVDCICEVRTIPSSTNKSDPIPPDSTLVEETKMSGLEILLSLLSRSYQRDSKLRKLLQTASSTTQLATTSTPTSTTTSSAVHVSTTSFKKHHTMLRENEDLLVKLIRLLANLSINPKIGTTILEDKRCGTLLKLLKYKTIQDSEELVLNSVSAVTNLSFYLKPASSSSQSRPTSATTTTTTAIGSSNSSSAPPSKDALLFFHPPRDVLGLLLSFLFSTNFELVSEVCRSLGNFSRDLSFRMLMKHARVDEAIILLLNHSSIDIVYGAVGIILNIAAHVQGQEVLFEGEDGGTPLESLVEVMERFGLLPGTSMNGEDDEGDDGEEEDDNALSVPEWPLVSMVLKTFLNLRTPYPPTQRPTSSSSNGVGTPDTVLKREIPLTLRHELSEMLELLLERIEQEQQHDEEDGADGAAPNPTLLEVSTLARQLLPSCVWPQQWDSPTQ